MDRHRRGNTALRKSDISHIKQDLFHVFRERMCVKSVKGVCICVCVFCMYLCMLMHVCLCVHVEAMALEVGDPGLCTQVFMLVWRELHTPSHLPAYL